VSEQHATSATTGRRSTGTLGLYVVGQLLVVAVGGSVLRSALGDASGYGAVFGAFLLGIGLVSLLATLLELAHGRSAHGAVTGTAPDGAPATVLPRAGWVTVISAGFLAVVAGCLVAGALVGFGRGDTGLAVLLLVLGAGFLALLAPVLLGRVRAGGVYLTAQGVTSVKDGAWWRVSWDDVAGVVPEEPLAVVLRDGARPERGRTAPPGWRSEVKAPEGVLAVQTRYLSEDAATLAFLLLAYRDRPDLRSTLGTQASLDWEILRAGS